MSGGGIVALLFTDLVGSTTMYDQYGDVVAEALRREHFALLREQVELHGGMEVKSVGDGLMVVFLSALDALESAIAIQRTATNRNRTTDGQPLEVRVGINVGEPIRDESDYFGISVNIARRLCDAAGPNQIYVSSLVRALAAPRGAFTFTDLGPLPLKGISDPVDSFQVDWQTPVVEATSLPPALHSASAFPFVGRQTERDALRTLWKRAVTGERLVVLLPGEPGIGKTRLVGELAREAAEDGIVRAGRSDPELTLPFQPFAEAFADDLHVETARVRSVVDRFPELRSLAPHAEPPTSDSAARATNAPAAIAALADAVAGDSPLLLVIDDAHWADESTLLALRALGRAMTPRRLLTVVTYRDTEVGRMHPLSAWLADVRADAAVTRLPLRGLGPESVGELLAGTGPELRSLAEKIEQETEGNPFFVTEVVQHLVETGSLRQADDGWQVVAAVGHLGVPEGVREVLGRRLGRLRPSSNEVLAIASVLGRSFELDLLGALIDRPTLDILSDLDEAIAASLVRADEVTSRSFSFAHALVRETLYAELPAARRMREHAAAATALIDRRATPALIAHHLIEAGYAGDPVQAAAWSLLAATIAFRLQGAGDDAIATATRGLEALGPDGDPTLTADLLLLQADALAAARRVEESHRALRQAMEYSRRNNDADRYARAVVTLGSSYTERTSLEDMERFIAGAPLRVAESALLRMRIAAVGGRVPASERQLDELLRQAESLGDREAIVNAALGSSLDLVELGEFGEARDRLETYRPVATGHDPMNAVFFCSPLLTCDLGLGDRASMERRMDEFEHTPWASLHDPHFHLRLLRAATAILDGDLERGISMAEAVIEEDPGLLSQAAAVIVSAAREQDRSGELLPLLVAAGDDPAFVAARAVLLADTGDLAEAARVGRDADSLPLNDGLGAIRAGLLAETAHAVGDQELAASTLARLEVRRGTALGLGIVLWLGAVDRFAAKCELVLGDVDGAIRSLEAAIEFDDAASSPLWASAARADLAVVCAQRGELDRARTLAAQVDAARAGRRWARIERQLASIDR